MSKRNKLEKFAELRLFPNVFEYSPSGFNSGLLSNGGEDISLKGRWASEYFHNENPIVLELACGRGEYTCGLAELYPEKNFIGIDVKGARIWKGAKYAFEHLPNAAFLRIRIEHITSFFDRDEVDEIWITFPDPFLKDRKANRRLTSPYFLTLYRQIMRNGGYIHLKTDDEHLYNYTMNVINEENDLELIEQTDHVYQMAEIGDELLIQTFYEKQHLANKKTIKYIKMSMDQSSLK
jgi:tRNA (guanine-N7-)-methyltransferase